DDTAMRGMPALSVCVATRCDQVGDQRAQAMRPDVRDRWSYVGHGILSRSLALLAGHTRSARLIQRLPADVRDGWRDACSHGRDARR
ncbi:hypothetical protein, partial [Xanthomonas hortorum]|uniref:hypothetical protein n=1 Tax=Xanthomonas hortorum TaxID=56454 RepID=UPI001F1C940A